MSFNDIFKNNFLSQIQANQGVDIIISLLVSVLIGAYIFYFYKKYIKGLCFQKCLQ